MLQSTIPIPFMQPVEPDALGCWWVHVSQRAAYRIGYAQRYNQMVAEMAGMNEQQRAQRRCEFQERECEILYRWLNSNGRIRR